MKSFYLQFLAIIICCFANNFAFAYNLTQVAEKEKLSNSAITALCQNDKGIMWIGTCDGLNTYDGREIVPYVTMNNENIFSGNIIDNMVFTGNNTYWIKTFYNVNQYDNKRNKIVKYNQFNKKCFIGKDNNNTLFIINESNCIYYFNKQSCTFKKLIVSGLTFSDIINLCFDKNNNLFIISKNGFKFCFNILINKDNCEISLISNNKHIQPQVQLLSSFYNDNSINSIDEKYNLLSYDPSTGIERKIINLEKEIRSRGKVSAIIKYNNKFFVGFSIGGLILLEKKTNSNEYNLKDLEINCGIFCLKKDQFQDLLWIGTDGQGIYMYSETAYTIKSTLLNNFTYNIGHPIRSLFLDKDKSLWIGSKGDGILKINNYDVDKSIANCSFEKLTSGNTLLNNNSVYCFARSKRNVIWIGNEEGLNYYSYKEKKIKRINIDIDGLSYKYIHSIYEDKNSCLWIATVGMGIIKAYIGGTINDPVLENIKHFSIKNNVFASNFFYSLYPENDSTILFGNRGFGPFKFNNKTETLDSLKINNFQNLRPINDVLAICKDNSNHYLFGTGSGLIQYSSSENYKIYDTKKGFLNNTVHAILQGNNNDIWLSTNRGIVVFDSNKNVFRVLESEYGQNVMEFSDGAAFKDDKTGAIFFGGVNGFVSIVARTASFSRYMPPVYFGKLTIFGEKHNIFEFYNNDSANQILKLKYNQNFFSVDFTATDFLNGHNYTYFYKLSGLKNQWINNGQSNTVSFTNISPGKYNLQVKYYNRSVGMESHVYSLNIQVEYPWYQSFWAYTLYFIITLTIIIIILRFIRLQIKHNEQLRLNAIEKKHQKEMVESKLDFFTNITHEFCTPLTLISGPCELILAQKDLSKFVANYVKMIKINAERLNGLIQELIEFRKIETENRPLKIESLSISQLIAEVIDPFKFMAELKKIDFEITVQDSVKWNTDKGFFLSIIINLLSNAFKYTSDCKKIRFDLSVNNKMIIIKISNEGVLNKTDFVHIFDKFTVLENFEKQDINQMFSRTGLGLAISSNMINLLNGTINIENTSDKFILFTVCLPEIEITSNHLSGRNMQQYIPSVEVPMSMTYKNEVDKLKPTILIIDDDIEMLLFISALFSDQFNTIKLSDSIQIDEILKEFYPDLIISDVMMPGLNGIELIKKIKGQKDTNHIPIILVSAKHEIEQQIEALASGAEMYITKPFNIEFLKISVNQLFERKEQFKEYLSSPISSFDLSDGKLTHKDHRKFLQSVLEIINDNITNPDLTTNFIADKLSIGVRSLTRKLEEIGEQSPSTLIRESRLFVAKNLLVQTTTTIDEIVFKSGFADKSAFFRSFSKKFNCTPKEYRLKNIDDSLKSIN